MTGAWTRRSLLAALGAVAAAGCTSGGQDSDGEPANSTGTPTTDDRELPEACPTSQDIDVEWPADLDADAAASFVEEYEHVYYRDHVVEYEPESRMDAYGLGGRVTDPPEAVGNGYVVEYSGSGGIYRPNLHLDATVTDLPAGADVVSLSDVESSRIEDTVETAAETGEAEQYLERSDIGDIDEYVDRIAALSADFEPLTDRGDSDSLFVDVDGTTVELTVQADQFHGDYWWDARYYVDDRVVRRTDDTDADPRDGQLLECRSDDGSN